MKLTKVEQKIAVTLGIKTDSPDALRRLRKMTRESAYHEAGHIVARYCTGLEVNNIEYVTIIPGYGSLARVHIIETGVEKRLETYPPESRESLGRQLLLDMLAGRGAVFRAFPEDNLENLDPKESWQLLDPFSVELDEPGSDLAEVERIAGIIARPHLAKWRVEELAEKWTLEMLAIPMVWQAVERLVHMLLERGTIQGNAITDACKDLHSLLWKMPKWKRRFKTPKLLPTPPPARRKRR